MNFILARPRFITAIGIASIGFLWTHFFSNWQLSTLEKFLITYNLFQWSYFISLLILIFNADSERVKKLALKQDENAKFLITTCVTSSLFTFIGIAGELSQAKSFVGIVKIIHLSVPAITLIGAWVLIPTLFAIHYAHLFYLAKNENKPLRFPEDPTALTYWDFLYFSITIAVASQTADVSLTNSKARKLVLAQSIFSFVFNTSVLALGINVAASLVN